MSIYHVDYETSSACDITLGAARYANDPSTRIILMAVAKDDGPPVLWDVAHPETDESIEAIELFREAVESGSLIYCHNVGFEHFITRYRSVIDLGVQPPDIEQWRCTASMARRASIPHSLAGVSEFLKLKTAKDSKGKLLIKIFSDQSKPVLLKKGKTERMYAHSPILLDPVPWDWELTLDGDTVTVREAWDLFCEYCRQDVRVEQQVHKALEKYEITGTELAGFQFDLRMNDRGIPVNIPALENAKVILDEHCKELEFDFKNITGLMPTQTAKVLAWLKNEGYAADNLQAETMGSQLGSSFLTQDGQRALEIRSQLSFAAVKKIPSMLASACDDGRMRGLFMWYGAIATGRWTSSGAQVQNARKPTIEIPDAAYQSIRDGVDAETMEILHGSPYEAVASCIRNFIQHPTDPILDADYSGIENRLAALLAGQESMLQTYRDGRDLYRELAAVIFGVPLDSVTKDQRFVGKTACLACIYQVGAKTFFETCSMWGQPISKQLASKSVKAFREENSNFPVTWRAYESAAVKAIKEPGKWFEATPFVKFARSVKGPFDRLLMRLPSGRDIVYPYPQVNRATKRHRDFETGETREWETDEITYYGVIRGTRNWGRVATYAGSIFQSSVQGTARDIMVNGCLEAEKAGFKIFALIHDQALAENGDPDAFVKALCTLPEWLPSNFPLAAEGGLAPYYKKD